MSTKKQGGWLFLSSGIAGGVQFSIFSMLAYYAGPEAIGTLAIVNVFLAIAFLVQDMGLSNYFIYKQHLTRAESSTLYYTNCILGGVAGIIIALLAAPVESFYQSSDIGESMYIMAFNFILLGMSAQYQANYIKIEKNVTLAKIDILTKLGMLISTFTLIKMGLPSIFPYLYSYLFMNLIRYFLLVILSEKTWHPTFNVDLKIIKPAIEFGSYQMGSQIISQVRAQLDQLIIGKLMGVEVLGLYSFAKELILQPIKFIRVLIARLVYPKLAKLQNNKVQLYNVFESSLRTLVFMNTAIYILYLVSLVVFVNIYFDQYQKSIPLLFILLPLGLVVPFGSLLGVLVQAKGNTKIEFKWNALSAVISVPILFFLTQFENISSFAIGVATLQILLTVLSFFYYRMRDKNIPKKIYLILLSICLITYALMNVIFLLLN